MATIVWLTSLGIEKCTRYLAIKTKVQFVCFFHSISSSMTFYTLVRENIKFHLASSLLKSYLRNVERCMYRAIWNIFGRIIMTAQLEATSFSNYFDAGIYLISNGKMLNNFHAMYQCYSCLFELVAHSYSPIVIVSSVPCFFWIFFNVCCYFPRHLIVYLFCESFAPSKLVHMPNK